MDNEIINMFSYPVLIIPACLYCLYFYSLALNNTDQKQFKVSILAIVYYSFFAALLLKLGLQIYFEHPTVSFSTSIEIYCLALIIILMPRQCMYLTDCTIKAVVSSIKEAKEDGYQLEIQEYNSGRKFLIVDMSDSTHYRMEIDVVFGLTRIEFLDKKGIKRAKLINKIESNLLNNGLKTDVREIFNKVLILTIVSVTFAGALLNFISV
ncbi:hypothetical protein LP316_05325 [Thalassotalea sp. LPB0316]|uniref:hypothetical protein n=1 Tax=Thalassotalea sp. LPB0316 TaxID=2769490 RepID=UPI001866B776|nr:hypothetical protein [Thalassotalea sp. LPB0316]QOL26722.1 hypothetical protein LP316_05325 [Thalassotalea sp. LPB0316]